MDANNQAKTDPIEPRDWDALVDALDTLLAYINAGGTIHIVDPTAGTAILVDPGVDEGTAKRSSPSIELRATKGGAGDDGDKTVKIYGVLAGNGPNHYLVIRDDDNVDMVRYFSSGGFTVRGPQGTSWMTFMEDSLETDPRWWWSNRNGSSCNLQLESNQAGASVKFWRANARVTFHRPTIFSPEEYNNFAANDSVVEVENRGTGNEANVPLRVTGMASQSGDLAAFRDENKVVLSAVEADGTFRLNNEATAETPSATHTLIVKDNTGTAYRLLAVPVA